MSILAAEEHNPLLPPLGEIIIGLIAFGIVLLVLFKFVAPRFEQVFRARREAIEGQRNWDGTLAGFDGGLIALETTPERVVRFPFELVQKASLKFEW